MVYKGVDDMANIILWGCGKQGKIMFNWIRSYWREYWIVGVADNNYRQLNSEKNAASHYWKAIGNVLSVEKVKRMYDEQLIDGVLVAVFHTNPAYKEIVTQLHNWGIPLIEWSNNKLVSDDKSVKYTVNYGNSQLCLLENFYIRSDSDSELTLIYNEQGKIPSEFYLYQETMQGDYGSFSFAFAPLSTDYTGVLDEACVLTTYYTRTNYWHFNFEVVRYIIALENMGFAGKYMIYRSEMAEEMMHLLGLENKVLWIDESNDKEIWKVGKLFYIKGELKKIQCGDDALLHISAAIQERNQEMFETVQTPSYIYWKRIGRRKLIEDDDFQCFLEKYHFSTVIPDNLTIKEQITYFKNAKVILMPHGAGSTNMIYMQNGTDFIELFGADYINPCCLSVAQKKHIRYHMCVETAAAADKDDLSADVGDYHIDTLLLELIMQQIVGERALC